MFEKIQLQKFTDRFKKIYKCQIHSDFNLKIDFFIFIYFTNELLLIIPLI
jgi:hypothetical protein